MTTAELTLQESSLKFNEAYDEFIDNLPEMMDYGSLIGGGTERGHTTPGRKQMVHVGKKCGYRVLFTDAESWTMVHHTAGKVLDHGFKKVIEAQPGPASEGGHGVRGLAYVKVDMGPIGIVSADFGHWVTHAFEGHPSRTHDHVKMTRAFVNRVKHQAKGGHLAFCAGDANEDWGKKREYEGNHLPHLFEKNNIVPIWKDLNTYPPTHGNPNHGATIDFVCRYGGDGRVSAKRVEVHFLKGRDHGDVVATYDVRLLKH